MHFTTCIRHSFLRMHYRSSSSYSSIISTFHNRFNTVSCSTCNSTNSTSHSHSCCLSSIEGISHAVEHSTTCKYTTLTTITLYSLLRYLLHFPFHSINVAVALFNLSYSTSWNILTTLRDTIRYFILYNIGHVIRNNNT